MNAERPRPKIGPAESVLLNIPPSIRGKIIRGGLERILNTTTIDYPDGYFEKAKELALGGHAFAIVANHESHADALFGALIGAQLADKVNPILPSDDKITGFLMPFALSMETGKQGRLLDILFKDISPILTRFGTTPVFTATENDVAQGRVEGRNSDDYVRRMSIGIHLGKGIIAFPEGRVEGGRRDLHGNIKGMQEFVPKGLRLALRIATRTKGKVAVIPVGISGGYNIYNPQEKNLPVDTFIVGTGLSYKNLVRVKVGMPMEFDFETVRKISSEDLNLNIGKAIAKLLPQEEQGVYKTL